MNLIDVLETFAQEVPALIACSVVSIADGTSIGAVGDVQTFDAAAIDAYFAEVVKKNQAALNALGIESVTEDVLVTSPSTLILARALPQTSYFWNVITSSRGSLGLTRALMRKYEADVLHALP